MFEALSDKLNAVFGRLNSHGAVTEKDLDEAMREVRLALLEADVNFKVVRQFIADVRERALGAEVLKSLTPTQQIIGIVNEELVKLLGGEAGHINRAAQPPTVIMLVGLQGSGKTTHCAKLALHLRKRGDKPLLVAADVYRPAAVEQLQSLGKQLDVPVFSEGTSVRPAEICRHALVEARRIGATVVIIDTAGRLHNKVGLMDELGKVKRVVEKQSPIDEVLLVLDATTGQNGLRQAEVFADVVNVTGIVLTKLDGTAKGGIVVAVQRKLGVPVKLVGLGEGPDDLAPFDPEAFVDAIVS
jgi:signal recognition particle subunit SRP54